MAAVKRIGIFCYKDTAMLNTVLGLKDGFEALGVEVVTGFSHLDSHRMRVFLDMVKPDFVLDINRSRDQIVDCDDKFHHIAWVQDVSNHGHRIAPGFGGSDMVYSTVPLEDIGIRPEQVTRHAILNFAIDPKIYFPFGIEPTWDVSIIAGLQPPLQPDERAVAISSGGVQTTLGEINDAFLADDVVKNGLAHGFDIQDIKEFLARFMRQRNPDYVPDGVFFNVLTVFDDRVVRFVERVMRTRRLVSITQDLKIFGNGFWPHDPVLRHFHVGKIFRPSEKATITNLSRLVFHSSMLAMHERVMEAMACGRVALVNRTKYDDKPWGIDNYFVEGEHFVRYDGDNMEDVIGRLLVDSAWRDRIGEQASRRVAEEHTWGSRAKQILDDFFAR